MTAPTSWLWLWIVENKIKLALFCATEARRWLFKHTHISSQSKIEELSTHLLSLYTSLQRACESSCTTSFRSFDGLSLRVKLTVAEYPLKEITLLFALNLSAACFAKVHLNQLTAPCECADSNGIWKVELNFRAAINRIRFFTISTRSAEAARSTDWYWTLPTRTHAGWLARNPYLDNNDPTAPPRSPRKRWQGEKTWRKTI